MIGILPRILRIPMLATYANKIPKGRTRIRLISRIIRKNVSFKPRVLNGERIFLDVFLFVLFC